MVGSQGETVFSYMEDRAVGRQHSVSNFYAAE
jgi:hypothetical protein